MSSRPLLAPFSVVTNGNMNASITSDVTIIQNVSMISYDISWTGSTPVGEVVIEVSNTYRKNTAGEVQVAGNWTPLTLSDATNISGNSGNGFIDIDQLSAYAIRLRYIRASGTGTMNVTCAGKVQ